MSWFTKILGLDKKSVAEQIKDEAQKALNAFKPTAISYVEQLAAQMEGELKLNHQNALELQTRMVNTIQSRDLPSAVKMALVYAVMTGVTQANVDKAVRNGMTGFTRLRDSIIEKIKSAEVA